MTENATPSAGDEHPLAAHYLPVMRLCLSRLHDPADAEDATQEVFRRAVQNADALRDDPLPWLITVARNVCTDELRRRRRLAGLPVSDDLPTTDHRTPEGVVVGRLAARELLGRLTPGERRAVAARLGALGPDSPATSTTRVLLARAREKVRQYLEDTQAAFGTATVSTSEALHQLRSRFLGRGLLGTGRTAVVIPALLMITVTGGTGTGTGGAGLGDGITHSALSALTPGTADTIQARRLRAEESSGSRSAIAAITGALAPPASTTAGGSITLPPPRGMYYYSLPNTEYRQVETYDIEPSPNYAADHTVLMIGAGHTCEAAICSMIFRSSDGGATWSYVSSLAVLGFQLVLPADGFPQHRFYVVSGSGVEVTWDDGTSFATVLPGVSGHALVPPASSGLDVIYSRANTVWGIRHDGVPSLLGLFQDGDQATGTPALLPAPNGYTLLEPVSAPTATAATPPFLQRCTPSCGQPSPLLDLGTNPAIIPSPDVAVDHTVFGIMWGYGLSVSHDDGATYSVVSSPNLIDMTVIRGPHGRRLVGSMGTDGKLVYSDDDGATWRTADLPTNQLFWARDIIQLRPGRLIASMERRDDVLWYDFVCSTDGASWSTCTPDRG